MTKDEDESGFREVPAGELERLLRERVAEAASGSPEARDARWELMRFLATTGRRPEAHGILEELLAAESDPEVRAEYTLAIGQNYEGLGDFAAAAEAYARGVALEPVGSRTWYLLNNNLGYSLNQLGRHAEAERWCRAAIQVDPERHNAYKNLGVACSAQGRHAEAIRCYITATDRCIRDPRAFGLLVELLRAHPEIVEESPELVPEIERCVAAVQRAAE